MRDQEVSHHLALGGSQFRRTGADEADIRTLSGEYVRKKRAVGCAVKEENRTSVRQIQNLFGFVRRAVIHQLDGQQIPAAGDGFPNLIKLPVTVVFRIEFTEGKTGGFQKRSKLFPERKNFGIRHGIPEHRQLRILNGHGIGTRFLLLCRLFCRPGSVLHARGGDGKV